MLKALNKLRPVQKDCKVAQLNEPQTIISVKEAKKLISSNLRKKLSDEQVEVMATLLESIAREYINSTIPKAH